MPGYRQAFDARGNRTDVAYFGVDGRPMAIGPGCVKIAYSYDNLSRIVEARYFDARGNEIPMELVVVAVVPGSTAEQLGITHDDRLLTYNGTKLTAVDQFVALVADETGPNVRVLAIRRGSQIHTYNVPAGRLGVQIGVIGRADAIDPIAPAPVIESTQGK
jgi:S1-C subfamily serine protease